MQKNIGIWGFGIVGKSILEFLSNGDKNHIESITGIQISQINVFDKRNLSLDEIELIKKYKANFICSDSNEDINRFLSTNDQIIISAGINPSQYNQYSSKLVGELDLFAKVFKKPSVAITGTLGKTTITKLIGELASILPLKGDTLDNNFVIDKNLQRVAIAGNIGKGLLSIVEDQDKIDSAILEFSSFQLDLNNFYSPDIALWTNFYPNHLDRHVSLENYFNAKFKLFQYQSKDQLSIISLELFNTDLMRRNLENIKSQICIVSTKILSSQEKIAAKKFGAIIFYINEDNLFMEWTSDDRVQKIMSLKNLPSITFLSNWVFILATLYLMGKDLSLLEKFSFKNLIDFSGKDFSLEPHRVEFCGKIGNIEFYNDSKATIMEATHAAIDKLSEKNLPIVLFIGGVGKGVDRKNFLEKIRMNKNVSSIVAFGKEIDLFDADIKTTYLEDAFELAKAKFKSNSIVLFSPSGASFDLFENYQKRGDAFKKLVREYEASFSKSTS